VPAEAVLSLPCFGDNDFDMKEVVLAGVLWHGWDAWRGEAPADVWQEHPVKSLNSSTIDVDLFATDFGKPHWLFGMNKGVAPAKFLGWQPRVNKPPFALYALTKDLPGHPDKSTVSSITLENLGYAIPETPAYVVKEPASYVTYHTKELEQERTKIEPPMVAESPLKKETRLPKTRPSHDTQGKKPSKQEPQTRLPPSTQKVKDTPEEPSKDIPELDEQQMAIEHEEPKTKRDAPGAPGVELSGPVYAIGWSDYLDELTKEGEVDDELLQRIQRDMEDAGNQFAIYQNSYGKWATIPKQALDDQFGVGGWEVKKDAEGKYRAQEKKTVESTYQPKTYKEQREILKTDKILRKKPNSVNSANEVFVIVLSNGSKGVWKPENGEKHDKRLSVKDKYWARETAASEYAEVFGFEDLVPATSSREYEGGKGSVQKFVEKASPAFMIHERAKRYGGPKDHARAAAVDFLFGNSDRHAANWMVVHNESSNTHKIALIDNGFSFPDNNDEWVRWEESCLFLKNARNMMIPEECKTWIEKWPEAEKILHSYDFSDAEIRCTHERLQQLSDYAGLPFSRIY